MRLCAKWVCGEYNAKKVKIEKKPKDGEDKGR